MAAGESIYLWFTSLWLSGAGSQATDLLFENRGATRRFRVEQGCAEGVLAKFCQSLSFLPFFFY